MANWSQLPIAKSWEWLWDSAQLSRLECPEVVVEVCPGIREVGWSWFDAIAMSVWLIQTLWGHLKEHTQERTINSEQVAWPGLSLNVSCWGQLGMWHKHLTPHTGFLWLNSLLWLLYFLSKWLSFFLFWRIEGNLDLEIGFVEQKSMDDFIWNLL